MNKYIICGSFKIKNHRCYTAFDDNFSKHILKETSNGLVSVSKEELELLKDIFAYDKNVVYTENNTSYSTNASNLDIDFKGLLTKQVKRIIENFDRIDLSLLKNNVKTLNVILETDEEELKKLKKYNAKSYYNCYTNTLLFPLSIMKKNEIEGNLISSLLYIASSNMKQKMLGFMSCINNFGFTLNKGINEYLTSIVTGKCEKFSGERIETINTLFEIFPEINIVNYYFSSNPLGLIKDMTENLGVKMEDIIKLIGAMDDYLKIITYDEINMTTIHNDYRYQYKSELIKLLKIRLTKNIDNGRYFKKAYLEQCLDYYYNQITNSSIPTEKDEQLSKLETEYAALQKEILAYYKNKLEVETVN